MSSAYPMGSESMKVPIPFMHKYGMLVLMGIFFGLPVLFSRVTVLVAMLGGPNS